MADMKKQVGDLTKALESHHAELASLSAQIEKLEQQRAILKAAAAAQLHSQAETIGLARESIGHFVAACL